MNGISAFGSPGFKVLRNWFVALSAAAISVSVSAQIVIGQTSGFTGQVAGSVAEMNEGAKLYLKAINAAGGVNGQRIDLVSLDDKFDPKLAAENARTLIEKNKIVAMFMTRGTPHSEAVLKELDKAGIPLIAPVTGAMTFHQPVRKNVFNVRAPYQKEAQELVTYLGQRGYQRVALIAADDSFGADASAGAAKGFASTGLKPVMSVKFDRAKPDIAGLAQAVIAADPQVMLVLGSAATTSALFKEVRKTKSKIELATLSINASIEFITSLGPDGRGALVSQVMPGEQSQLAIVQEMGKQLKGGFADVTPAALEGYVSAKVLVEALRRAGKSPTPEKIIVALESTKQLDVGALSLSYGPDHHTGLEFTEISMISKSGKFIR
jgi:branched-chain amino acid transport system substrate-binding protein